MLKTCPSHKYKMKACKIIFNLLINEGNSSAVSLVHRTLKKLDISR